ncbi:DUF3987 domain-containing protein [Streptacidiphilus sp. N1-12]|uniref:DUF3987 domain-containing protein n=2 Tax=Streptacidiphilus alkalitolerans TaxID=3342712 RepID=A0ABV6VI40_9ACTN
MVLTMTTNPWKGYKTDAFGRITSRYTTVEEAQRALFTNDIPPSPFAAQDLPSVIGDLIISKAANLNQLPDMCAMVAFGVISAATCGRFEVETPDYTKPCVLWTGAFAPSGFKKTPVMNTFKAPLVAMQGELQRAADALIVESDTLIERLTTQVAEAKKAAIKSGDWETHADLSRELATAKAEAPKRPTLLVSNITPEALVHKAAENQGRLTFLSDEGQETRCSGDPQHQVVVRLGPPERYQQ